MLLFKRTLLQVDKKQTKGRRRRDDGTDTEGETDGEDRADRPRVSPTPGKRQCIL